MTFFCVAKAFTKSAGVGLIDFFSIMPIERTVSSLPISLAGIGWREKILQILLSQLCHIDEGVAALIGSMSFLIILVCSAPGGLIYLLLPAKWGGWTREVPRYGARGRDHGA